MSSFQDNCSYDQLRRLGIDTALPPSKRYRRADFSSKDVYASESSSTSAILSASSYPIPQPMQLGPNGVDAGSNHHLLYGGFSIYNVENEDENNGDDDAGDIQKDERKQSSQARSTRRRSKKDKSLNNETSRKRGRPRILTKDETSTERRRTQIRLAQRAYRLRKESTISTLNDRVAELECTIEEMSKSFLSFNDELMTSRLLPSQPDLLQSLRNITEKFLALSRLAKTENDDDFDFSGEFENMRMPTISNLPENGRVTEVQDSVLPSSASDERNDSNTSSADSIYEVADEFFSPYLQSDFGQTVQALTVSDAERSVFMSETLGEGSSRLSLVGSQILSEVPYMNNLQEPSFARRLKRSCFEYGCRLLADPACDPETLLRVFRLALGTSSRKLILSRLQGALNRASDEIPEAWNLPFFHLGGAGTHYPRRDVHGNPLYPPNMHPISEAFGFWTFQSSEIPEAERNLGRLLNAFGFDGEWFDSHDVEGFLREKGIFLDDQSAFLEVPESSLTVGSPLSEPARHGGGGSKTTGHIIREKSPFGEPGQIFDSQQQTFSDITNAVDVESRAAQLSYGGLSAGLDTGNILADIPDMSNGSALPHMFGPKKSSLTIDVGQFVDRLVSRAICLGRSPGFRKRDVEDSLQYAIRCV